MPSTIRLHRVFKTTPERLYKAGRIEISGRLTGGYQNSRSHYPSV